MTGPTHAGTNHTILAAMNQASNPTSASLSPTDSSLNQSWKAPSVSALSPTASAAVLSQISAQRTIPRAATDGTSPGLNSLPGIGKKTKKTFNPFATAAVSDGRYSNFVHEQLEKYPRGYPSVAAFISADIDGRVYRRFSYVRNRLLLWYQDQIVYLEKQLANLDEEDREKGNNGEVEARQRLISRRYDEKYSQVRRKLLEDLEAVMAKYDTALLREHEIMSIQKAPAKVHKALFDFVWNGKEDADGQKRKHLLKSEIEFLYHQDDFMILGSQEDAWLGSFAESIKSLLPQRIRNAVLASSEDRKKSANLSNVSIYSNKRIGVFVKGIVCAASTLLLVVPVIILYALSIGKASGWLKIGVLLIFVVTFAFLLAALTNASRSEMFGASAGYCAVLIVFLTYSGP